MSAGSEGMVDEAVDQVERVVHHARPWLEPAARFGYAAKGFVYALIGVLAILIAAHVDVGQRANDVNQKGVMNFIARQTYGTVLLLAIAAGLLAYSLWRFISAALNAEDKGPLKRMGYAISGITYTYLAWLAGLAVFGARLDPNEHRVAYKLGAQPFGRWLVLLAGAIILGIAIAQMWNAATGHFKDVFDLRRMSKVGRRAAIWFGRIGFAARGVLFGIIGGFFIMAGITSNIGSAGGVGAALRMIQRSAGGNWLLGAVCVGLLCYGVFMFFEARFRRMPMTDLDGQGPREPAKPPGSTDSLPRPA